RRLDVVEPPGTGLELLVDRLAVDRAAERENVRARPGRNQVSSVLARLLKTGAQGELLRLAAAEGNRRLQGLLEALDGLFGGLVGDREVDTVGLALQGRLTHEADHELVRSDVAMVVSQGWGG